MSIEQRVMFLRGIFTSVLFFDVTGPLLASGNPQIT